MAFDGLRVQGLGFREGSLTGAPYIQDRATKH